MISELLAALEATMNVRTCLSPSSLAVGRLKDQVVCACVTSVVE